MSATLVLDDFVLIFDGFKSSHFYGDDEHNNIVKLGYKNDEGHSGKREMEYMKKLEKENKIEFVE